MKLVCHHTYNNGRATDLSGSNNHGVPRDTIGGPSTLQFTKGTSEVRIPMTASLQQLDAIRARIKFRLLRGGARDHRDNPPRQNLIEGHMSFALFVTPFKGLMGTIFDASGTWRGAKSVDKVIHDDDWHVAELRHDGNASLWVLLDGVVIAQAHDVQGPVRGVGPKGIAIGHWPEPDPRYTLAGWVDDVKIYKEKIDPDDVLDDCCTDYGTLDKVVADALAAGFTPQLARQLLADVRGKESALRTTITAGDPARARRLAELSQLGGAAVASGDQQGIVGSVKETARLMLDQMSEHQIRDHGRRVAQTLYRAPLGDVLRQVIVNRDVSLIGRLAPVIEAVCQSAPDTPDKPPRPPRDNDPDTDRGRPSLVDVVLGRRGRES